MVKWSNLLLISGTGRNVGKTTLACGIIKHISANNTVIAIKITPHFHSLDSSVCILYKSDDLIISEENNSERLKDSSKMLASGASKVYYVQGADSQLKRIAEFLHQLIPKNSAVVCESAAMRRVVEPSVFVLMSIDKNSLILKNRNLIHLANKHVWDYDYSIKEFKFEGGVWIVEK